MKTRLVDLKKGDKFYPMNWEDEGVYELLDLTIIHGDDSQIFYSVREIGTKIITTHRIYGENVINHTYICKFKGRDEGSFISGFKAAMRLYHKHMQVFDKENAGLNNDFQCWMTMNDEYKKWIK